MCCFVTGGNKRLVNVVELVAGESASSSRIAGILYVG